RGQPGQQAQAQDDKAMQEKAGPPGLDAERIVGEAMNAQNNPQAAKQQAQDADPQRRAYRQAVMQYMRENGLENPQRIVGELNAARILRAVYSERQLQEVMVNFWENHFNIYAQKGADRWFLTSYDRDVIRPNALGNFRDLLEATAKSPAMLFYLDNFQSVSPNAQMNRALFRRQQGDIGGAGQMRPGGLFGGARMRDGEARARRQAEMARRQQQGQTAQQRPAQQRSEEHTSELQSQS